MHRIQPKETSVYSTSAIDLFCSALGVFIVIFFMAMASSGGEGDSRKGQPMVMFVLEWNPKDYPEDYKDVDLLVQLPGGEWNYYKAPRLQEQSGGLVHDDFGTADKKNRNSGKATTPCFEIWSMVSPPDGEYKFYVSVYLEKNEVVRIRQGAAPAVTWRLYTDHSRNTPSGTVQARTTGSDPGNTDSIQPIGTATIKGGKVTFHPN